MKPLTAEVQPWQDQKYPRDEWRQLGRRQTDTHTEGYVEEVAFFFIIIIFRIAQFF